MPADRHPGVLLNPHRYAGSLRAELLAVGSLGARPLVAAVPVSVRSDDEHGSFGNASSMMMVELPTHLADPVERLRAVSGAAERAKVQHRSMGPELLEAWAGLAPPWAVSVGINAWTGLGMPRLAPPVFNLIVSNVPGPPIPLFMAGARVAATYPLGPLIEGSGLNITVFSQCDDIHVGVIACPDLVENPDAVVRGVEAAVQELRAAVPASRRRSSPGRPKSTKARVPS